MGFPIHGRTAPSTFQVVYPFQFVVTGVGFHDPTVDGEPKSGINSPVESLLVENPIIYKVLAPSQMVHDFFHQQYQLGKLVEFLNLN